MNSLKTKLDKLECSLGTNDKQRLLGYKKGWTEADFQKALEEIEREAPGCTVIVISPPPRVNLELLEEDGRIVT
jgi:hypothetical protein